MILAFLSLALMPLAFAVTLGVIVLAGLWLHAGAVRVAAAVHDFQHAPHPRLAALVPKGETR